MTFFASFSGVNANFLAQSANFTDLFLGDEKPPLAPVP